MIAIQLTKTFILNLEDFSLDAFALPSCSFNSVTDLEVLDDHVLVFDGLPESFIIQDVPLILVREVVFHTLSHLLPICS
jgi:hypothetical protein